MARILMIDDHEEFRRMSNLMLVQAGHQVIEASNGVEGLKLYDKDRIDLVITDLFMPDKDGIETVRELKMRNDDIKIVTSAPKRYHFQRLKRYHQT